ncbi:hypothetical protein Bpfe_018874 [Biomphalaria pfeifferi]|uniref:Uncharacterized protein n=1 Tax=Biomphalaria pfeifferi TaxID=112525 RepID=A0AAD8BBT0_BIOPF|nr:hypothetical protein Bpfe_018874 [Biomphalaria pfeifferi]
MNTTSKPKPSLKMDTAKRQMLAGDGYCQETDAGRRWILPRDRCWQEMDTAKRQMLAGDGYCQETDAGRRWILPRDRYWQEIDAGRGWMLT